MNIRPKRYFPTRGWLEDFPQFHGMDGAKLLAIRAHVEERLPHVRSVLVARHGYVVFEMHRQGFGRDGLQYVASITKSVTALAVGIAVADGSLRLDDRIVERWPGLIENDDPRAARITVRHLLTMTAGFDWLDAGVGAWLNSTASHYPHRRPMQAEPGAVFNYDTPASHVLSGVLQRATGAALDVFVARRLFAPLGIERFEWQRDADGFTYAGHGLSLGPRDVLKLGLLALRRGEWDGAALVPAEFVDAATSTQSAGYPDTFGEYGYLWWVQPLRGRRAFYAAGHGGQFMHVVPELDLLVLVTSNLDRLHAENKQIARDFALPAVIDA
jgi:CubicO group peptidase (beta-lactamase class C family)